jgi:hypothetical protein
MIMFVHFPFTLETIHVFVFLEPLLQVVGHSWLCDAVVGCPAFSCVGAASCRVGAASGSLRGRVGLLVWFLFAPGCAGALPSLLVCWATSGSVIWFSSSLGGRFEEH